MSSIENNSASAIIPVYNGEESIVQLTERLYQVLSELFSDFEIILVDDCSPDGSWEKIEEVCARYPKVRATRLMRNFGQHNALLCGIRQARFPITITLDDDLQHPPEQIPLLYVEFLKGFDVVYAIPRKLPHSFWRNIASKFSKWSMSKIMGVPITEIGSFRIFKTDLRKAFERYSSPDVYIDPLLSWGTSKFSHVTVDEAKREYGHSNYSFKKLVRAMLLILTGYSTAPLRFASALGFIFMLFGIGVMIYVFTIFVTLGSTPGFPFLASIISIFAGVQLFTIGIIGEYLARIYDRSTDRPPYVVSAQIDPVKEVKHES